MKTLLLFILTAAGLTALVAGSGFALDSAVLLAVGASSGIVGLLASDYRRLRPLPDLRRARQNQILRPPLPAPPGTDASADWVGTARPQSPLVHDGRRCG